MNVDNSFGSAAPAIPAEFVEIATICTAAEVSIGGQLVLGINDARALHAGLRVGRDYNNWMRQRITKYGFQADADYQVFAGSGEKPSGGRPTRRYAITLDMAKELAMVENNEIGRLVRRYFIWLEKIAHARPASPLQDYSFDQWSNEELRTRNSTVTMYRQVMNNVSAMWMMERLGFPIPPAHLLPQWRQSDMWDQPAGSVTITVTPDRKVA